VSRGARIRICGGPLAGLSHAQAVLACDAAVLRSAAAVLALGGRLTSAQAAALRAAGALLADAPTAPAVTAGATSPSRLAAVIAEAVAVAQRDMVTAAVVTTLQAENWTVTVVAGSAPDRCTGIEASCGTGHVVVAVGAAELLADQAGPDDHRSVTDLLVQGLREVGWIAAVEDGIPPDRPYGSLYNLPGQPTRAHAVQASLRQRQPVP
jgi:hypothetical protein